MIHTTGLITLSCLAAWDATAQESGVVWTKVTAIGLPPAVRLYMGERASPLLQARYRDADLSDTSIAVGSGFPVMASPVGSTCTN
jgi:hypothetical protein